MRHRGTSLTPVGSEERITNTRPLKLTGSGMSERVCLNNKTERLKKTPDLPSVLHMCMCTHRQIHIHTHTDMHVCIFHICAYTLGHVGTLPRMHTLYTHMHAHVHSPHMCRYTLTHVHEPPTPPSHPPPHTHAPPMLKFQISVAKDVVLQTGTLNRWLQFSDVVWRLANPIRRVE